MRDVSLGFLAPIFFVTAGFEVTFDVFQQHPILLAGVIAAATVAKIVGTALFYLPTGYGWREGVVIGAGMNGRGAVEIIIAQIGLSMGIIDATIFSILVFMAIFTTATVPVLLKLGVDWLKRRNELVRSDHERRGVLIIGAGATARALGR
ncbi:cation:proton antiporter, partial [Rhodothermus marinus]|uniref:cation:proton antiporter n=1 Tax=Rhodothermus marinus TaxID=29549 RepID=UPI000A78463C